MVWNAAGVLPDRQFPVILKALFGYRDLIYLLQAVGYIAFARIVRTILNSRGVGAGLDYLSMGVKDSGEGSPYCTNRLGGCYTIFLVAIGSLYFQKLGSKATVPSKNTLSAQEPTS